MIGLTTRNYHIIPNNACKLQQQNHTSKTFPKLLVIIQGPKGMTHARGLCWKPYHVIQDRLCYGVCSVLVRQLGLILHLTLVLQYAACPEAKGYPARGTSRMLLQLLLSLTLRNLILSPFLLSRNFIIRRPQIYGRSYISCLRSHVTSSRALVMVANQNCNDGKKWSVRAKIGLRDLTAEENDLPRAH